MHDSLDDTEEVSYNIITCRVIYVTDNIVLDKTSIQMSNDGYFCGYLKLIYEVFRFVLM